MIRTEIIAYLGATAWLPQIATWFYVWFSKPKISVTPEKTISIGYTRFGPIFNLRLSLDVRKKDALVDFIGVQLTHQNGSKHLFEWAGMTEFFSEVRNERGESQQIQRDVVPIAIKLSTLSLAERFFKFRDSRFIEKSKPIINELDEHAQYLRKINPSFHDEFLSSKAFDNFLKFMREGFWWKAGKYSVIFIIRSPEKINYVRNEYEFELMQDDIDSLEKNLNEFRGDIEYMIKMSDIPDYQGKGAVWNWRNPTLEKINPSR